MPCDHYASVKISEDALNTYGNVFVFNENHFQSLILLQRQQGYLKNDRQTGSSAPATSDMSHSFSFGHVKSLYSLEGLSLFLDNEYRDKTLSYLHA